MNDNKKDKGFEELADEELDRVAGGCSNEDEELDVGYIMCSYCGEWKTSVDTYQGPSGTLYLCNECYEKHHKALGV